MFIVLFQRMCRFLFPFELNKCLFTSIENFVPYSACTKGIVLYSSVLVYRQLSEMMFCLLLLLLFPVPPEVSFRMPHRVSQAIGKEVMFECFVAAFPHGVGQWTKDGKPVTLGINHSWRYKTEMYKVNVYTFVITLRIINVEDFDFGTYTCEASNNLGVDSDTILFFGKLTFQIGFFSICRLWMH